METRAFVHDPSMIRQDDTYYVFSTGNPRVGGGGIQIRASEDLRHWRFLGTVTEEIPAWIPARLERVRSLWAPDVSFYRGRYQMFYAGSRFGKNTSVIGLATNATLDPASPDYRWVDEGLVIESTGEQPWNAIDANFATDAQGAPWLDFGSFWTGIKMVRLDPDTRKPAGPAPDIHGLARRPTPPGAVEAPFIIHRTPYHYLFVSFDICCRGVNSTYKIAVGRSTSVTGPYLDADGVPMMEGGGTILLQSEGAAVGPGGQSVLSDRGRDLLVYHYYDAGNEGRPELQIRELHWTEGGWPVAGAPLIPHPSGPPPQ